MTHNSSGNFKLIHFLLQARGSYQSPNFDTLECSSENLPNSSYHFSNHKSVFFSNFASLFSVMKDNSSVLFFSSNNIYFAQKEPIKVNIFETFKCSGQNLSNSPCQFLNNKSIPLQILHYSSVS